MAFFFGIATVLLAIFVWQTVGGYSNSVYRSAWFIGLALLLALNTAFCLIKRGRRAGWSFVVLHAGIVVIIVGSVLNMATRFQAVIDLTRNRPVDTVLAEDGMYRLPFAVELNEFAIDYYRSPYLWLDLSAAGQRTRVRAAAGTEFAFAATGFKIVAVYEDFALSGPGQAFSRSAQWNNPAVRLQVDRQGKSDQYWVFLHYPSHERPEFPWRASLTLVDAEIKNYRSGLRVRDGEQTVSGQVAVNEPWSYQGYCFYQSSYDPADPQRSLLTVKREGFVWMVYGGFVLLIAGVLLWLVRKPY